MITSQFTNKSRIFELHTLHTSYLLSVTEYGHLEHLYYGPKLRTPPITSLRYKRSATIGSCITYHKDDPLYSLDNLPLEYSSIGCGDYRFSPIEIVMPDKSFVADFTFQKHSIIDGPFLSDLLPGSYGNSTDCQTLILTTVDLKNHIYLTHYYTVYEESDVITRRCILQNSNKEPIQLNKIMSSLIDIPNRDFDLISFDGGWSKETHKNIRPVTPGIHTISSTTGASSNRHNPGIVLAERSATDSYGLVYGFNLVYSGNHCTNVELSNHGLVRISQGINPHCFEVLLNQNETFETPEAIMTCSNSGFNQMSQRFHFFINHHIVRGDWKLMPRPILLNNWEATFFDFNEAKIISMAKQAKNIGIELFVLDDGWFSTRNSDTSGLGDYDVNTQKLPSGISGISHKIHSLGLKFGLWFEPEMINIDSKLYQSHPEYAIKIPNRTPTFGRNQLVLDLCKKEVQDYIIASVSHLLDEANIDYVKWDMNRHISDIYSSSLEHQGAFFHEYILGLYRVLKEIFYTRPHILLESCSSGGNRFDLGMLCFSPQIWASDDTDPIERLSIQEGLSYLYPLSTIGSHVSAAPHQQTLRQTPLSTRFHVSCYGCLGYELDLKYLSSAELKELREQISFYKIHRMLFQYGLFYRTALNKDQVQWEVAHPNHSQSIVGFFQQHIGASPCNDILTANGISPKKYYQVETVKQTIAVQQFGGLIKHITPITLNPNGLIVRTVDKHYRLPDCMESYECYGDLLAFGIPLNNQFMGSYYNQETRLLGDYGSNLYLIQEKKEREFNHERKEQ